MGYAQRAVAVSSLDLDVENPRFRDGVLDQRAAMAELLATPKQQSEMLALARSVVDLGGLDPSTLPVVVEESGRIVVLEGNRRVAVLKLLRRPSLAPTESLRVRFEKLAASFGTVPESIRVVAYDERPEYEGHLRLRHTGENSGAGLKPWRAPETARFRERSEGTSAIHTALLAWCDEQYVGDIEMLALVERVRSTRLTTLKRVLMKSVRPRLGLSYSKERLTVEYAASQLRAFLMQLFSDILDGTTSQGQPWSRANQDDVKRYVFEEHADLLPPSDDKPAGGATTAPAPEPPRSAGARRSTHAEGAGSETVGGSVRHRSGQADDSHGPLGPAPQLAPAEPPAARLFPGVDFNQFGQKVNALGKQAQKVSIDSNPELCGVLCRIVIDLACTVFLGRHRKTVKEDKVWRRVTAALRVLDTNVDNPKRRADAALHRAWKASDKGEQGLAVDQMNDFVHATIGRNAAHEVRHLSEVYTPLLYAMEANLRQSPPVVAADVANGNS